MSESVECMTDAALSVKRTVKEFSADVACFIVLARQTTACLDYASTAMQCVVNDARIFATTNASRCVTDVHKSARSVTRECCAARTIIALRNTEGALNKLKTSLSTANQAIYEAHQMTSVNYRSCHSLCHYNVIHKALRYVYF